MLHRVPSFSFAHNSIRYSQKHSYTISKLQSQISSGSKLASASDDPIAFRRLGLLRETAATIEAGEDTVQNARSALESSSNQLVQYGNLLTRAKVLAQQGVSALGDGERAILASEITGILARVQDIANAKHGDKFLFGGSENSRPPFHFGEFNHPGRSLNVAYQGSTAKSVIKISESIELKSVLDGRDVFQLQNRSSTLYLGTTGAAPGQGTDNLVGRAELTVAHDTTTYLGASGIATGTQSSEDTIIGPPGLHQLTIVDTAGDGSAGTIQLNQGEAVAFTNGDTNLQVLGTNGEVVFVDTTSIAAGFNGTVDIEATGTLTIDGVNQVNIDFTNAQQVADDLSGGRVFVDSANIRRAGTEHLEFAGANNAFEVLHELQQDLLNDRGLNAEQVTDAIGRRLGELDALATRAQQSLGQQAASLATLEDFSSQLTVLDLANQTEQVEIGAVDITEAVLQLRNAESLLEYTFAVSGRLSSIGLLDFLR